MPDVTTLGFPFPLATDPLTDGAASIEELARELDTRYAVVVALPASPGDGERCILVDDLAAPTFAWTMQWHAAAARWLFVGGAPCVVYIGADEISSGVNQYVDLATVGPAVTVPRAGAYVVSMACELYYNATGVINFGLKIGAAAVANSETCSFRESANDQQTTISSGPMLVAAAALDVLKMQYKDGGGTAHFRFRKLSVAPSYLT